VAPALSPKEQEQLDKLAEWVLEHYDFKNPPVPIEAILRTPPKELGMSVDITDLSLAFGLGEHPYEYRMAIARLLYREICRHETPISQDLPYYNEATHYFAACLLIPQKWILKAARRPLISLQQLSESFQVPEYVMTTRLTQLGKHVRGMR